MPDDRTENLCNIALVGQSGAGKTTLARGVATMLRCCQIKGEWRMAIPYMIMILRKNPTRTRSI
ncbi:MAG: hypothetical protein R3E08_06370 [Thiotrichaceae bacterium]